MPDLSALPDRDRSLNPSAKPFFRADVNLAKKGGDGERGDLRRAAEEKPIRRICHGTQAPIIVLRPTVARIMLGFGSVPQDGTARVIFSGGAVLGGPVGGFLSNSAAMGKWPMGHYRRDPRGRERWPIGTAFKPVESS